MRFLRYCAQTHAAAIGDSVFKPRACKTVTTKELFNLTELLFNMHILFACSVKVGYILNAQQKQWI